MKKNILGLIRANLNILGLPMMGTASDVLGTLSAIINMNTANASKMVTPRLVFSPDSAGRRNTRRTSIDNMIDGRTMFMMKYKGLRRKCNRKWMVGYDSETQNVHILNLIKFPLPLL